MVSNRTFAATFIATLFSASLPAFAADLIAKAPAYKASPVFSWTGFYVGGHAGYGWSKAVDDLGSSPFAPGVIALSVPLSAEGSVFGAQAGYDIQADRFVFGVVADISKSRIRDTATVFSPDGNLAYSTTANHRLDWIGTVRGRFGILPTDRALVYGTGGYAYGRGQLNTDVISTAPCSIAVCESGAMSKSLAGWTAGGGLEFAFWDNWSFLAEYLYYDLGRIDSAIYNPFGVTDFTPTAAFKGSIVRAGLNYRFGAAR